MAVERKQVENLIQTEKAEFLRDYRSIVESPSISVSPSHKENVRETANLAKLFLERAGGTATIFETNGHPGVLGRLEVSKSAPTVAVYNHLDVQPATRGQDGWTRDPFKFTEENGRFYSRGTTDDKGPAMTALWGARIARKLGVPINVEFIWELEEEIGSPHFEEFLQAAKHEIHAKAVVVSDTIWLSKDHPSITTGLRGLLSCIVTLATGKKETHSGTTGGPARNPIAELCAIVDRCVNARTGEILIPGFAATWKRPTKKELAELKALRFNVRKFQEAHGLMKLRTSKPEQLVGKIWYSPTFEVHGITGGYQGPGVKTIVPPSAELKCSFRLVPGQDPDRVLKLFRKFVKKLNPDCEVHHEATLPPYLAPRQLAENTAVVDAMEHAFGRKPIFVREGGSIGAVLSMQKMLKVPILFMGLSLPEDGYHGPDESFAWNQIEGGVHAFVRLFENLAKV